jgi:hypothetical protein
MTIGYPIVAVQLTVAFTRGILLLASRADCVSGPIIFVEELQLTAA